jgi:hypothetical protein
MEGDGAEMNQAEVEREAGAVLRLLAMFVALRVLFVVWTAADQGAHQLFFDIGDFLFTLLLLMLWLMSLALIRSAEKL